MDYNQYDLFELHENRILTIEIENGIGGSLLSYPDYFVDYYFNNKGIAEEIVINNIDLNAIEDLDLINSKTSDTTYYYLNETYEIFINEELNKISFTLN